MTKSFRNTLFSSRAMLFSACLLSSSIASKAQTITLFRTGVIVLPTYTTLSAAIAAASANDSLVVSPHTFKENGLVINKNLIITGTIDTNGTTTIDAEFKNRGILISSGNVKITDLVVKNGKITNEAGGGICNYGSGSLTILGYSSVQNCSCAGTYANGGGIFSAGKLFIGGNTSIKNNSSDENAGGVYAYSTFVLNDNASITNNKTNGSGGGVFSVANGAATITDNAKIEHNTAIVAGGGMYGVGKVNRNASISDNTAEFGGGIAAFNDILFVQDAATINNNIATTSGAGIWLNNCSMYGTGSFKITNNKIPSVTGTLNFGGAIYNVNGNLLINGGTITGNQSPIAAIYNSSGAATKQVSINSTHIYNPKIDGTRQSEVFNSPSLPSSIITFTSDSCWWGSNDTSKLIANKIGTSSGTINTYIVSSWVLNNGNPITSTMSTFPLRADFKMNDGSKFDSLRLRSIQGNFIATKGSFNPSKPLIDTSNAVRSTYNAPAASDSIMIMAVIDADTFKTTKIAVHGLSIINNTIETSINVYPNPAQNILYIHHALINSKANVYNLEGRIVLSASINSDLEEININSLTNGFFILEMTDANNKRVIKQFMKQ